MVADRFGALLQELSSALHVALAPDSHNACHITFPNKLSIWMEPDAQEELLQIVIEIGNPGDGRYRENLFREALRANGRSDRLGTFCYGAKREALLLTECISFQDLNGQRLADIVHELLEKALVWKDAIARSELPPYQPGTMGTRITNVFGLR